MTKLIPIHVIFQLPGVSVLGFRSAGAREIPGCPTGAYHRFNNQMASFSEKSRIALATWLCQYVALGDKKGARENVIRVPRFICPVEIAREKKHFVTEEVSIMPSLWMLLGDDVADGYF